MKDFLPILTLHKVSWTICVCAVLCLLLSACRSGQDNNAATATDTTGQTYILTADHPTDTPARYTDPAETDAEKHTDTLYGDFDGDGRRERIWVQSPDVAEKDFACKGPCECLLRSSDSTIMPVKTEDCIDGMLINYGDLNGDGGDEVGMIPLWFTSCWGRHFLFTLRHHKWIKAIPGSALRCESYDDPAIVRRDPMRSGYVILKYYDVDSGFERLLEKSVKMQ